MVLLVKHMIERVDIQSRPRQQNSVRILHSATVTIPSEMDFYGSLMAAFPQAFASRGQHRVALG
jgi:hypothetical protein